MINIYRMEKYRALKSNIIRYMFAVVGLFSLLNVYTGTLGDNHGKTINICRQFTDTLSFKIMFPILAIVISVYISGEYKNGFLKSIAGQIPNKSYLVVSKVLFVTVYTIELFAMCFISTAISSLLLGGTNITIGFEKEMIALWCAQILLHVGFSCILILITNLTRGSAAGVGLGIFTLTGLTDTIFMGISWLVIKSGLTNNFDLGGYMLEKNTQNMIVGIPASQIIKAMLVGIIFIVIMSSLSIQLMRNRDI